MEEPLKKAPTPAVVRAREILHGQWKDGLPIPEADMANVPPDLANSCKSFNFQGKPEDKPVIDELLKMVGTPENIGRALTVNNGAGLYVGVTPDRLAEAQRLDKMAQGKGKSY